MKVVRRFDFEVLVAEIDTLSETLREREFEVVEVDVRVRDLEAWGALQSLGFRIWTFKKLEINRHLGNLFRFFRSLWGLVLVGGVGAMSSEGQHSVEVHSSGFSEDRREPSEGFGELLY